MFDFDTGKLLVIGIVALVVIGPKELPRVLRQVGQTVGKVRRMASEFQSQFMEAMREAEIADVKEEMGKIADAAKIDVAFDPVRDVRNQIGGALADHPAPMLAATEGVAAGNKVDLSQLETVEGPVSADTLVAPPISASEASGLIGAGIAPTVAVVEAEPAVTAAADAGSPVEKAPVPAHSA